MPKMLRLSSQDLHAIMARRDRGAPAVDVAAGRTAGVPEAAGGAAAARGTGSGDSPAVGSGAGWVMLPYPVGSNRVWRQAGGKVIPNPKAVAWKRTAAHLMRWFGLDRHPGPVIVHYRLHPKTNKDGSACKVRLDVDAPAKALLDACNGVVWIDDKQVVRLIGELSHPVDGGGLSVRVSTC